MTRINKEGLSRKELEQELLQHGDVIKGKIERIFFKGKDGWMSGEIIAQKQKYRFCGVFLEPLAACYGIEIQMFAAEVYDTTFGPQLQVPSSHRIEILKHTKANLQRYLSSDLFPSLRKEDAKALVSVYGTKVLEKVMADPRDAMVKCNLTEAQVMEFQKKVSFAGGLKQLQQVFPHLTEKDAKAAYLVWQDMAIQQIRMDPYILLKLHEQLQAIANSLSKEDRLQYGSHRIPFNRVDEIARLDCGVSLDHPTRLAHIGVHALKRFMSNAKHRTTYLLWDESTDEGMAEIREFMNDFYAVGKYLPDGYDYPDFHRFILTNNAGITAFKKVKAPEDGSFAFHLYLYDMWYANQNVTEVLKASLSKKGPSFTSDSLPDWIGRQKQCTRWTLTSEQEGALNMVFTHGISFVCGGPGRGKTYWTSTLIRAWQELVGGGVLVLGPTGRAVNRIKTETGYEHCETAARFLLRIRHADDHVLYYTERDRKIKAGPNTLVIVDEVSMFSMMEISRLFHYLSDCTMVFLGDKDQLPPIEVGDFLSQVLLANQWGAAYPVTEFSACKRTDASGLITNFDAIRDGHFDTRKCLNSDFLVEYHYVDPKKFMENKAAEKERVQQIVLKQAVSHYQDFVSQYGDGDVLLVCPVRQNKTVCTNTLNAVIQNQMNPVQTKLTWVMDSYRDLEFLEQRGVLIPQCYIDKMQVRLYDRVMNTKNHADMDWFYNEDLDPDCGDDCETGCGIYNGDMGRVLRFYRADGPNADPTVLIALDDGRFVMVDTQQFMKEWTFGYAVTIHKAQGSEASCVMVVTSDEYLGFPGFLHRNLFYTGVTRAKEQVLLLGCENAFHQMAYTPYYPDRSDLALSLSKQ